MKRIAFLAAIAILSLGTPALGGPTGCCQSCDDDMDGVCWAIDNCQVRINAVQDDTDADDCGNLCDADYDQNGVVDFGDFGAFATHFGVISELHNHTEPVEDTVDFGDFGFFASAFGAGPPGPSGTTIGTIACP
jgi:hypothetical protein